MESLRQQKINRLLAKELSELFRIESLSLYGKAMITVTRVKVTKDVSIAKIYLSLFLVDNKQELLEKIRQNGREIRHKLSVKVKSQLRVIPDLAFYLDDSLDYIENIDKLLNN